ncbi:helix-turn-helix domain-containing protein [Merismopedia glauca]|uniref:Transcriptional regulator n=2 Tax=Merismopedia TaxID=53402 RepID=A0A2T1BYF1_9CYAN|nr:transcriptional regulator [Merismopedia glauca CCAP 1448/3]
MKKKSPIMEAIYEDVKGLHAHGLIDKVTMRRFDARRLPRIEPLSPEQIKDLREKSQVSQSVFALILNTSVSTVQKWEIGRKRPSGSALKLLHLINDKGLDWVL